MEQIEKVGEALTSYRVVEPSASIARLRRQLPYRNAAQPEQWEGLLKCGLPDDHLGVIPTDRVAASPRLILAPGTDIQQGPFSAANNAYNASPKQRTL